MNTTSLVGTLRSIVVRLRSVHFQAHPARVILLSSAMWLHLVVFRNLPIRLLGSIPMLAIG